MPDYTGLSTGNITGLHLIRSTCQAFDPASTEETDINGVGGSEKRGHFGRIVALLQLAATTSGISPRSGPDDSFLCFSFERSSRMVKPPAR
jgi:hypothetical protein